ncbi:MAG TPA: type II toxin-antitoxin system RelB/DinJ family antitoxin [Silvibacterium sp.]|jgi:DNA-damage-inducible protein J|nr:type II toxin-antitoxin system RelB/DinJ family antitoxin [Silvibacterium sp.]
MSANALVQTRIDPEVKARAAEVLETMGLTVSDAVRILLTRTANEGALPFPLTADPAAYDLWFRSKVQQALDDPRPPVPHADVEAYFARRRTAAREKAARKGK